MYGHTPLGIFKGKSWTSDALGASDPKVGDVMYDGSERYRFIYNNGASSAPVGHGVVVSALVGYSCTVSSVTMVDLPIGVVKHAAIAASSYGWVCQEGFTTVEMHADQSCAAGALLILGADGVFTNKTISTGFVGAGLVKAVSAIASGASGSAYISL